MCARKTQQYKPDSSSSSMGSTRGWFVLLLYEDREGDGAAKLLFLWAVRAERMRFRKAPKALRRFGGTVLRVRVRYYSITGGGRSK